MNIYTHMIPGVLVNVESVKVLDIDWFVLKESR